MIKFNHVDDSYFGAMGITPERFADISKIFRDNGPAFQRTPIKSVAVEDLVDLINPQNSAEYLVIGMLIGGHEAHYAAYRQMVDDMREKFKTRDDDVNDF